MLDVDKSIKTLTSLATEVHQGTERANLIIQDLERRLDGTKIGIEVWLDEPLAKQTRKVEADETTMVDECFQIGWTRVANKWRIASKRITVEHTWNDVLEHVEKETFESEPQPLVNSPRMVRIEAAPHLERLPAAIEQKARAYVEAIRLMAKGLGEPGVRPTAGHDPLLAHLTKNEEPRTTHPCTNRENGEDL